MGMSRTNNIGYAFWALVANLLLVDLSGCATPPSINPRLSCVIPTPNERAAMALIRKESSDFAETGFIGGNSVRLLINGPVTYEALRRAIASARSQIDMESYEFDGAAADAFASQLISESRRGIRVHLIYDAWGSSALPRDVVDRMRSAGIQIVVYNPISLAGFATFDINRRDHRKLLIIDGQLAITGGINIGEVYQTNPDHTMIGDDAQSLPWRDTDLRIEGPGAMPFEQAFARTWAEQGGPPFPSIERATHPRGDGLVQMIDGSPMDKRPAIYRTWLIAMAAARRSVHMTTGFFAPTHDLMEGLECAARRGIDVKLILPGISTSPETLAAGRSHYEDLLESGVHIYERKADVLHAKTAVIDSIWSTVGSADLDWRSIVYNDEINAVTLGPAFGGQMEDQFQADLAHSTEITRDAWRARGLGERIHEWRARLLEPLL